MNPNDLSIPELENILARKDEYRNGMDFWDKLNEGERGCLNNNIPNKMWNIDFIRDREVHILSLLLNPLRNTMRYESSAEMVYRIQCQELYLKIVSDFNLFLGFQRYINYRLFLLLKEVK